MSYAVISLFKCSCHGYNIVGSKIKRIKTRNVMSGFKILITNSLLFSLQRGTSHSLTPKYSFKNIRTLAKKDVGPNDGFLRGFFCGYEDRNYLQLNPGSKVFS